MPTDSKRSRKYRKDSRLSSNTWTDRAKTWKKTKRDRNRSGRRAPNDNEGQT